MSTESPQEKSVASSSDWDAADENPRNWASSKKWTMIGVLSLQAFVSPLASSIMAPALPDIGVHYHFQSASVTALTLSIFLLAWVLGPLLFGPLSEVYGRKWTFIIANFVFLVFNIACIFAPSGGALIAFRFLAGLGASLPISTGSSIVSDMFVEKDRAGPTSISFLGVLLGPPIGPIMGGYMTQTVGFKYCFVVSSALCGAAFVIALLLFQETYGPLLHRRYLNMTGAQSAIGLEAGAKDATIEDEAQTNSWHYILVNMVRPFQLLFGSFICFIFSLYAAIIYGILNAFFTTFPTLFEEKYNFGPGATGLTYIGGGVGELLSAIIMGAVGASIYTMLRAKHGNVDRPEFRIPAMLPGSILTPAGLFWFGWSAQADLHWMMPIIGASIFSFGMISSLIPIQLYFLDTFTYAASALAVSSAMRSGFGFVFPLFTPPMISALGNGGTYSLWGGLLLLTGIPFPLYFYKHGERLRKANHLTK
ncbi:MFS general substrate transporter [Mycena galopus ATCC 62051]|nr:MFS general substrate transporter [Mycena galopus ATCC 62051]